MEKPQMKDISDTMRKIASKKPLWKNQLGNYKAQQVQNANRKQRGQGSTKVKADTNEKNEE